MVSQLRRGLRPLASAIVLSAATVCVAGCSSTYQLGSLFGKHDDNVASADTVNKTGITGSATPASLTVASSEKIADSDVAAASAAATNMLATGGNDTSAPWQNPETGARGMVTALAATYSQEGFTCRDFLASVVREDAEAWLQGAACRVHHGKWVVRSVKPWKRA